MFVLQIPIELAQRDLALYFVLAFAGVITYLAKLYKDKMDSNDAEKTAQIHALEIRMQKSEERYENYITTDRLEMQKTLERNTEVLEEVLDVFKHLKKN
ncbi:MAG: hypothetical protein RI894_99 [Bacteroidota bacterium]